MPSPTVWPTSPVRLAGTSSCPRNSAGPDDRLRPGRPRRRRRALRTSPRRRCAHPRRDTPAQRRPAAAALVSAVPPGPGPRSLGGPLLRPERRSLTVMDSLHERLARLALSAAGDYGFCLAGGYAVQAHGFLDRPSEDVDLFTTSAAEEQFPEALATVIAAYKGDGLDVSTTAEGPGFARLQVTDPTTAPPPRSNSASTGARTNPSRSPSARSCTPMTPSRTRSAPSSPAPKPATTSTSTPSSNPAATQAMSYSPSPSPTIPASTRRCS